MATKKVRYTAVGQTAYNYPEGVITPGQSAELTEAEAARGLASGQIAPTQMATKATSKNEES